MKESISVSHLISGDVFSHRTVLLAFALFGFTLLAACLPAQEPQANDSPHQTQDRQARTAEPTRLSLPRTTGMAPSSTPSPSPSPTSSATPTETPNPCWSDGGRIEQGELRTPRLNLPMNYRVYLPPCYDQFLEERYPTLYLIHGQSFNDDQWQRLGAVQVADALIAAREISPFIMIMPHDRYWDLPPENRFGETLLQDLIPWIDEHYRTIPDRHHRAIGGISRGGGWAFHLGLSHPEVFSAIGGHSLALFDTDAPYYVNLWLDDIPTDMLPRIYLDIGDRDRQIILRSTMWFADLLEQKGIPHEWRLNRGGHDEEYWQANIEEYIHWYASQW